MKAAIVWLVGTMHVCTPYMAVARDIYRRCRRAGLPRSKRKLAIKYALQAHKNNRDLVRAFNL